MLLLLCSTPVRGFVIGHSIATDALRSTIGCPSRIGRLVCSEQTAPVHELTMEDVGKMFRDVRAHYRRTGDLDEGQVCRNMMVTRVKDFYGRIDRCEVKPSDLHGEGLFATRDIEEGDLITFFPSDALLVWEGGDRKHDDVMMFFGAHVPQSERDAKAILSERVGRFELFITEVRSFRTRC